MDTKVHIFVFVLDSANMDEFCLTFVCRLGWNRAKERNEKGVNGKLRT
jgi:hypothetical protein